MRKCVYEIGIGLRGIRFDEESNAILITEFAQSGNASIKSLAALFKTSTKVANSKGNSDKANNTSPFKLKANNFSVYALPNSIQVHYDFGEIESDLLGSRMDSLRGILDSQYAGIEITANELNTKDQSVNKSYKASGFSDINDAYDMSKIFNDLIVREEVDELPIKFPGTDLTRNIKIQVTPDKPDFEPDEKEVYWEHYEIVDVHKRERCISVTQETGKVKRKIMLDAEQYTALFNSNGFSLNDYELYNFTVKQIKPALYKLIDVKSSDSQMGLSL